MKKMTATEARKKDAREKIELGGLVVKAGLRHETRALVLGLLIDAVQRIKADDAERTRLSELGVKAFSDEA